MMQHDPGVTELAPSQVIATWKPGSFAENLAVTADGQVFVSLHTDCLVVRVDPSGTVTPFASFDRPTTGLALATDGSLIVSGGAPGTAPGVIWRVSPSGDVTMVAEIAEAVFLNGITPLDHRMLVAESALGRIYAVDPASGAVETWLADPMLTATDGASPGANGVKLFGSAVTISVTSADRLVRASVLDGKPGKLEILAERLRADDFAFDVDGALYIATHPARSLLRLAPDGKRTTLAGPAEGMTGATAVAFGRGGDDHDCVYVTTTGGTMTLPDDQLEPAKLVRVQVGRPGLHLLPS